MSNRNFYYNFPTNSVSNSNQSVNDNHIYYNNGKDHIYYNIEISNSVNKNGNKDPRGIPASYSENLTQPIINNPSDYYLTILRFTIPGSGIPILTMDIQPNQPDINLTPYSFTLNYNNIHIQKFIMFKNWNNQNLPRPPNPIRANDPYYFIFEYNIMIQMMNTALKEAFNELVAAVAPAVLPVTEPPFFIYDETTQLISIIAQKNYSPILAGEETVKIYANTALYTRFLSSLFVQFDGYNKNDGRNYHILFPPVQVTTISDTIDILPKYNDSFVSGANPTQMYGNRYYTGSVNNPPEYLINTQEYNTIQYWNSFKKIVFTTNLIPIQSEYVPSSSTSGNNHTVGTVAFRPILTDYEPLLSAAGDCRSELQYFNQGEYRLVDLISTSPLQKIDIQVYWEDFDNNLYPVMIASNQLATIKMLFVKKDLFLK